MVFRLSPRSSDRRDEMQTLRYESFLSDRHLIYLRDGNEVYETDSQSVSVSEYRSYSSCAKGTLHEQIQGRMKRVTVVMIVLASLAGATKMAAAADPANACGWLTRAEIQHAIGGTAAGFDHRQCFVAAVPHCARGG